MKNRIAGMKNRKGLMTVFVLTSAVAALLTMATALSITDFLQLIFPSDSGSLSASGGVGGDVNPIVRILDDVYVWMAAQGVKKALLLYAGLLLVLYGLKNLFTYISTVVYAKVKTGVLRDIRNGLHRSALRQDFAHWSSQAQGQWLSRMSNDVVEYETNVLDSIQMLVAAGETMVIYIAMLFYLNWRMTLMVIVVMALGTLLLSASRRLKRESRKLQQLNGDMMTTTQETIDSLKEIKAATAIDYVNDLQKSQNQQFTSRRIAIYRRIYAASPLSDFVGNVIVSVILIIGAMHAMGDALGMAASDMPASLFVSYIMIYVLLLTPIKDFSNAIAQLKKGRGVEERLKLGLECGEQKTEKEEPGMENGERIESIEMRDVSFGYGEKSVLNHLYLKIAMHKWTALTGESGSGKTTIGRLLVGLLEPVSGDILINGKPSTGEVRTGRIAYIPQEPMLMNDTMEENIRFGREWIGEQEVWAAAELAQIADLVRGMPEGMKTRIGDGGSLLSGGERQRVSIARALAGKPDVVVMDEATAALDAETEEKIMKGLKEQMADKTMVIIAHRLSTIAECDEVVRMEN